MRKRTLLLFASLFVFLIGILIMPADLTYAKEQTKKQSNMSDKRAERDSLASLRALYQDKTRFNMLSSAGQLALERRLGIKTNVVRSQRIPQPKPKKQVGGGLANVLVNNPAQDATAQDTQSETALILSGPNIVAGFNDSGSFLGGEPHFTGVSYSSDGGATFTDIGQLPDSGEGDAGDPALARNSSTGRVYLTTLGFNTFSVLQIFRSDDNGVTWMPPVSCCFQGGAFQDKEWITVDNAAGAGQGNVYIAWRSFGDGIYFVRSTDNGDTWSNPIKVADQGAFNVQGAFVMTGPNHEIYVAYIDNQSDGVNNFIKVAKSTDLGLTFSPGVTVTQLLTAGVNGDLGLGGGFRSNAFPHAVVNPGNGDVYVTWNDDVPGADKADIFYSASTDGGATWSSATNITDIFDSGTNDDWQPTIAITPSGAQAFVGWYDREGDPANNLIDWYGAVATVGSGVLNFLPQQRISNQNFPVVIGQDPVINPVYMGDYDTAVADNGFLHTVWGDNRDPDGFHAHQPDVRYAKITLGPTGTLQGFVTDSGTSNPIQGALVEVTPGGGSTTTDANGFYSVIVPIGTYDVTASAFGYLPQTVNGVVITDGGTTNQDFALDQAPISTVTGTVFDNSGHGWGLYARITIDGYPNGPVFTNAATGVYSVDLPQGTTFTFHVSAVVPGYFPQQRDVDPGQNPTEDFGLDIDGGNCNAPGYGFGTSTPLFTDDFEGGLGNWTADGLWNPENESDTCGSLVAPFPSPTNDAYFGNDSSCTFDVGIAQGSLTTNAAIDVPASGKATLTFYSYEQTECGGECFYDNRYVEVSNDGGSTWTTLADLGNENTWYQATVSLAAYSGQSILLRFRFDSIDDIGNGFFGWMVDSVDVSVTACEVIPGGLVVGNVYDSITGLGLNGAKVTSDEQPTDNATTFATPEDPNADDGLYVLFSSLTGLHNFTASKNLYGSDSEAVDVAADDIVVQNFSLGTGHLVVTPTELEDTVDLGSQDTQQLTVTNDGNADATFEIQEGNGLVSFKVKRPQLPKAKAHNRKVKGKVGPTSVMAKNALQSKLKALFSGKDKGPAGGGWTPTSNMPVPMIRYAHAQCDETPDSFYVISGVDSTFSLNAAVQRYDADTDTWTTLAPYPNKAEAPTAVCFQGRIYVANGAFTSNEFFIYDIATDTWLQGANLPRFVEGGAMGAVDGKVYLIGGDDNFQPADGVSNQVNIYDIGSDTWTGTGASMPEGVSNAGMVQAGPFVYVVGGWNQSSPSSNSKMTQRYDMSSDTWEVGPSFDLGNSDFALSATDTALYAAGGDANGGGFFDPSNAAQRLDLGSWPSGTWTDLGSPLPEARLANNAGFCTTAASGGEVWSTGGLNPSFVVDGKNQYHNTGEGCAGGGIDVPWLSENPVSATVPAGEQVIVDVTYDASQVDQPGDYFAHLTFKTDTPFPAQKVNVTMHVPVPPNFGLLNGTVTGLSQCDLPGGPIEGATVFVDGPNEDFTLTTDANGQYSWFFDAANSPVDITVSAPGYIGATQSGVVMNPGQTTTVDFTLRLDAPCLTVDQPSLDQTLPLGGLATQQLTISNSGAGDANYKIHESGGAAVKHATPKLPKAIAKVDTKRLAMSGPTSVRSLKNARPEKLKGLFPAKNVPQAWISGATNPNPVIRYGHAQCDDTPESFYVISGVDTGFGLSNAMSRYDADTDSWTSLAPYPNASEAPTAVCFEGKIYVANGSFTSNEFFVYDVATDSWSSAATLPRFVEGAAMGAFDGKIYLMGGDDDFQPASGVSNEVDIYDIATNTWTGTGASMPTATANAGYVQAGSFVYVVGGWGNSAPAANVDQTQRYDMSSDLWEVGPTFTVAVSDFALSGTDTALYAMGGDQNGNGFFEPTTTAQRLDLSTWPAGSWADLGDPLPSARQANQAGFCSSSFTGGEVWTTDAFDGGSVSGINQYRTTGGEGCASGSADVPWLSENPDSGVVPAGGSVVVDVTFDASQVTAEGDYFAQLKISGNAPGASPTVDVAMHVVGGGCDYAQDFNDTTMEWIEEKPDVDQPGDGFLHLTPLKKKAIAVADSSFAGATTGVFNFDVQFSGGTDAKNWIYTHRVDKKNQMEVLFKIEQGKVVVKDRGPNGIEAKAKADFALAPNTPYDVSIAYNGTAYAVTINGTTVISGFSPVGALPSANIGAAAKNDSMLLDNVCVIEQ